MGWFKERWNYIWKAQTPQETKIPAIEYPSYIIQYEENEKRIKNMKCELDSVSLEIQKYINRINQLIALQENAKSHDLHLDSLNKTLEWCGESLNTEYARYDQFSYDIKEYQQINDGLYKKAKENGWERWWDSNCSGYYWRRK
jgi:chromosome segregation ATPase